MQLTDMVTRQRSMADLYLARVEFRHLGDVWDRAMTPRVNTALDKHMIDSLRTRNYGTNDLKLPQLKRSFMLHSNLAQATASRSIRFMSCCMVGYWK